MKINLRENIEALQQGERLLQHISDSAYTEQAEPVFQSSVGIHIRHNLDHYACFLKGLESGCIDYAARQRNARLEQDRSYAIAEMARLRQRLENLRQDSDQENLLVERDAGSGQARSSIRRELEFLLSHTIHHYAIVAVICRLQGLSVGDDFGVAPSTLRHRASLVVECAH